MTTHFNQPSKKDLTRHLTISLFLISVLTLPLHSASESQKPTPPKKVVVKTKKPMTEFATAKPGPGNQQTLEEVLTAAYEYNSDIKGSRASVRAADEEVAKAKSGYRPTLDASGSVGISNQVNSGTSKDQGASPSSSKTKSGQLGVQFTQNIFKGWDTDASVAEAESRRESALLDLMEAEQSVFMNAITSHLTLLTLAAEVRLLKASVAFNQEQLNAAQAKFNVGEETRTSVAQAQAQLVSYMAQLTSKEAELEAQKAKFTQITGLTPGALIKPKEFTTLPQGLKEATDIAITENLEVRSRRYLADAAEHAKTKASSGLWPKIDFKAGSSFQRSGSKNKEVINPANGVTSSTLPRTTNNQTNTNASLEISFPLYEGGAIRAGFRQAHEQSEQRRIEVETKRREVISKLAEQWAKFLSARANVEYYRQQVAAYEVSLEGTRQELAVGTKILLDVLDEQAKLTQAQQSLVNAEKDYYIAGFQLMSLIGRLTATHLNLPVQKYDADAHYQEAAYSW